MITNYGPWWAIKFMGVKGDQAGFTVQHSVVDTERQDKTKQAFSFTEPEPSIPVCTPLVWVGEGELWLPRQRRKIQNRVDVGGASEEGAKEVMPQSLRLEGITCMNALNMRR